MNSLVVPGQEYCVGTCFCCPLPQTVMYPCSATVVHEGRHPGILLWKKGVPRMGFWVRHPGEAQMSSKTTPHEDAGSFAEDSALTSLFGTHPKTKILAALLSESRDVNVTRIAELAGVSRSTVYDHLDDLEELRVVEQTRTVGGSPLYQINRNSDVAKKLAQLEWDLLDEFDDT